MVLAKILKDIDINIIILMEWQLKLKMFIDKYNLDIRFTQFTIFNVT